jgi:RNA polymerase sigma-70 factor (family 1)
MRHNRKNNIDQSEEKHLVKLVRKGDEESFRKIYLAYYAPLCSIAVRYLGSYDSGKEVVQEVFLGIWEKRENWYPEGLKSYLYRSVYNRCLNAINQDKSRMDALNKYQLEAVASMSIQQSDTDTKKLSKIVWDAINKLPKRRYLIFTLHKTHGLTYREIAESLCISEKTVENQMGRALKFLRKELSSIEYY